MPVNSFEDYPLTWSPDKSLLTAPIYLALAELLERDIVSGKLAPHTKLPPQRELADFLDVNLSTITRTFKRCETKGLLYATVGKGTFVSPNAALPAVDAGDSEHVIQLGPIRPYDQCNLIVADTAKAILQAPTAEKLFAFDGAVSASRHARIAQQWLDRFHITAATPNILLTAGVQNGLVITLLALFRAGDKIATDTYTYYNFISLAKQFHIQLIPIDTDRAGMLPDVLARQSKLTVIKGVYLMPSCANPTAITMPLERRQAIGQIISQHNMILIEDDTYGFAVNPKLAPMASLIPGHTVYAHGMSKFLAAGLRIAYLVFPDRWRQTFLHTANHINSQIPPLNAEIASQLMERGTAMELIKTKCRLAGERNRLYQTYFPEHTADNPYSFFQWLPLPVGCHGYHFEVQAKNQGVQVLCSERFAAGSTPETSAIRIATCSPPTMTELATGLQIIQELIEKKVV